MTSIKVQPRVNSCSMVAGRRWKRNVIPFFPSGPLYHINDRIIFLLSTVVIIIIIVHLYILVHYTYLQPWPSEYTPLTVRLCVRIFFFTTYHILFLIFYLTLSRNVLFGLWIMYIHSTHYTYTLTHTFMLYNNRIVIV